MANLARMNGGPLAVLGEIAAALMRNGVITDHTGGVGGGDAALPVTLMAVGDDGTER